MPPQLKQRAAAGLGAVGAFGQLRDWWSSDPQTKQAVEPCGLAQSWLVWPFLPQLKQRVCVRVFLPPSPPVLSPCSSCQAQRGVGTRETGVRCAAVAVRRQCVCSACAARAWCVCGVARTFFALVQSAHRTFAWKPLAAKAVCSRTVNVKAPLQSLHTICWSCSVSAFLLLIALTRGLANLGTGPKPSSKLHPVDISTTGTGRRHADVHADLSC